MDNRYKVLLVEDESLHKELIFRAFDDYEDVCYEIIWVESIQSAKETIGSDKPDVVLSDMRLMDGEGIDLIGIVKDVCPLILMTSFGNEEIAVKSLKAGVADYIVKSPESFKRIPITTTRTLREWKNEQALKDIEQALVKSEERYRLAYEGANDIIWDWDLEKDVFFLSRDVTKYTKTSMDSISKQTFFNLLHEEDVGKAMVELDEYLKGKQNQYVAEYRIKMEKDEEKWISIRGKGLFDEEKKTIKRMAGSITDISDRKKYEKRIEELAFYDSVSGLPNRILFLEKLWQSIKKGLATGTTGCVIFVKVNNFKYICDLMGYDFGEQLLKKMSDILVTFLGEDCLIARLYGAEFSIALESYVDKNDIVRKVEDIIKIFKNKVIIIEQSIYFTINMGISLFPSDGNNSEELLNNAKLAMYASRKNGNYQYVFFEKEMKQEIQTRLELEQQLREAVIKEEFVLYYQPQLDFSTNSLFGYEALIRWNSKEKGIIPPNTFIPIAEETGLIIPIGNWVLKEACKFAKKLFDDGVSDIYISVNISAVQLIQSDFVEKVIEAIEKAGIPACMLGLEITESSTIDFIHDNIDKLKKLRDVGIHIFLDDFGTGYSSLNYIDKLPIDVVKIDKSFIDNITSEGKGHRLTESIMHLLNSLGLIVLAEGVETSEQVEKLKSMKCDIIQGYFLSRPVPQEKTNEFNKFYKKREVKIDG